jgi:hypothetical protein
MNYGNQQTAGSYASAPPEAQPTPMTRDINCLGENLARLEANLDTLRTQLQPVIRPQPEPGGINGNSPQLVKTARSSVGDSLEGFAAHVERLIGRVQFLQSAIEV